MLRKLVQSGQIEVDGRHYVVHYFEHRTARGGRRFSAEVVLGPEDRIIVDDDTLISVQARVAPLAPATIDSRALAAKAGSVAA